MPTATPADITPSWEIVIADLDGLAFAEELRVLIVADMRERDQIGRARYGAPLAPHNGRDSLIDAYQECLDLCVYLRTYCDEKELDGGVIPKLYVSSLQTAITLRREIRDR